MINVISSNSHAGDCTLGLELTKFITYLTLFFCSNTRDFVAGNISAYIRHNQKCSPFQSVIALQKHINFGYFTIICTHSTFTIFHEALDYSLASADSVSYTHLDVYKRQVLYNASNTVTLKIKNLAFLI